MFNRRTTLAAVCVATAMLMLDIAVVNTALTHIARSLHTGVSGVQWVVDAYTLALAATVLTAGSLSDRFGRRRALLAGLGRVHRGFGGVRASQSIVALTSPVPFRASAPRRCSPPAWRSWPTPSRSPPPGARAFAAYGATIGGCFASALRRRRPHQRARVAVHLLPQHPGRHALRAPDAHRGPRSRVTPARAGSTLPVRPRCAPACSCSSWPCCEATRTGGRPRASSLNSPPPPCSSPPSS